MYGSTAILLLIYLLVHIRDGQKSFKKKIKRLEVILEKTKNNRFVAVDKNSQSTNKRELWGLGKEADNVF